MFPVEDGSQAQYNVYVRDVEELLRDAAWLQGRVAPRAAQPIAGPYIYAATQAGGGASAESGTVQ
jgi:hypothetical protein